MKRAFSWLRWLFFIGLALFVTTFLFLRSELNQAFDQNELKALDIKIKSLKPLPEGFYKAHLSVNGIVTMDHWLFNTLTNQKAEDCPCLQAAQSSLLAIGRNLRKNVYTLAWQLERKFTQRQCLAFVVANTDFLYSSIGIEKAANFYFKKSAAQLNTKEYHILALMQRNPVVYNPKRDSIKVEEKLFEILKVD